ncbi:unnamed protein product [Linum tenue]|uniref:Uncharacterized protein n=1 Tax=Linum tenue TaxID=586396 RepID=A0AAV0ID65_9ROSI|nr:unnamed protein product [Linum tenue]CAI0395566.1 unnamed protein product [Linum tenue]
MMNGEIMLKNNASGLKDRDIIELNVKLDEMKDSYRKLQQELDQSRNDDKLEELQKQIYIMNQEMESNQKAALEKEDCLLGDLSTANELVRLYKRRSNTYAARVREAKATIKALTVFILKSLLLKPPCSTNCRSKLCREMRR